MLFTHGLCLYSKPKREIHPLAPRSPEHERYLRAQHWPSLDGLRGVAILPVIWHHATPRPLDGIAGKGAVGVDLFFALSGFLITTLLLREKRARYRVRLGAFYVRRALRIFPLYYLVLLGYVTLALSLPSTSPMVQHFWRSLPYHASYTANWFVDYRVPHDVMFAFSWSLCVEEQFYWLWPVTVALLPRRRFAALAMAFAIAFDQLAEHGALGPLLPPGSLALRIVTSFAAPIGFGSLFALLLDAARGFEPCRRLIGTRPAAPLLLGACLLLLALPVTPYWLLAACLAALVGAVAIRPDHGLSWLLDRPALRWLGTLSYAAYLLHVTALGLVRRLEPSWHEHAALIFAVGLPLTLLLALAAHFAVERPFLRLRRRWH
jgi:peptidoglycan/LPS O-acetylase OafA/YrhL